MQMNPAIHPFSDSLTPEEDVQSVMKTEAKPPSELDNRREVSMREEPKEQIELCIRRKV